MIKTVEAIYEDGVLKLSERLPLPEKSHLMVTIQTSSTDVREENLASAWGDGDDVFNELLEK